MELVRIPQSLFKGVPCDRAAAVSFHARVSECVAEFLDRALCDMLYEPSRSQISTPVRDLVLWELRRSGGA